MRQLEARVPEVASHNSGLIFSETDSITLLSREGYLSRENAAVEEREDKQADTAIFFELYF